MLTLLIEICSYLIVISGFAGIIDLFSKNNKNIKISRLLYSGLLVYLIFFTLLRWAQPPHNVILALYILIIVPGNWHLIKYLIFHKKQGLNYLISLSVITLIYLLNYYVPWFVGGIDAKHYTMEMAWAMDKSWIIDNTDVLGSTTIGLFEINNNLHRAPEAALGWLNNITNIGIDVGVVQRQIMLFFLLSIWQLNNIYIRLKGKNEKIYTLIPVFICFIVISFGQYYLLSLSNLGQLNTSLAIFFFLSISFELIRLNQKKINLSNSWKIAALSFLILTSYSEVTFILPLFIIISILSWSKIRIKKLLKLLALTLGGILPVLIINFNSFFNYLSVQATAQINAHPLGVNFENNLSNVFSIILLNNTASLPLLIASVIIIALIIGFIHFLIIKSSTEKQQKIFRITFIWFFILYTLLSIYTTINTVSTPNYLVFKWASWLSPLIGLILINIFFWLKSIQIPFKKVLCSLFILIIISFAGYKSYHSYFYLTRYKNSPIHNTASFAPDHVTIENDKLYKKPLLLERDESGRVLYNLEWIRYLAPWKNIPIAVK